MNQHMQSACSTVLTCLTDAQLARLPLPTALLHALLMASVHALPTPSVHALPCPTQSLAGTGGSGACSPEDVVERRHRRVLNLQPRDLVDVSARLHHTL
eukprot:353393-Chlamydomonas_euryale.AAC.2